jgi:hypothetical protein
VLQRMFTPRHRRIILLFIIALAMFCGTLVRAQGAVATQGSSQISWAPSNAPMPTVLPNGAIPQSMRIAATSCSSTSFCVAVGTVGDASLNSFPLAEMYSGGVWTPLVLPMPANTLTTNYEVVLNSVSCPSDGVCAATGNYLSTEPNDNVPSGLLEWLSSGVWSASEGALPSGASASRAGYIDAVSCSSPSSCLAVGEFGDNNSWSGLLYFLDSGTWRMEVASIPFDNNRQVVLNGVSCPDDSACVVVGTYIDADQATVGLILTMSSGTWTATPAPMPANVETDTGNIVPAEAPSSVSCPEVGTCVAGGLYAEANQDVQPLLMQLVSGVWSAFQPPVPSDSESNPNANIEGVFCPADGVCIATGYYFTNLDAGDESGMILTQSNGIWTAATGPLPPDQTNSAQRATSNTRRQISNAASSSSTASLAGVSCAVDGFCAAGGSEERSALLETAKFADLPSVTSVSPSSGPAAGGTDVTITGSNFAQSSLVHFGSSLATATYVSATELKAVAPPASASTVDVSVATGGLRSRAHFTDIFSYAFTSVAITTASVPLGVNRTRYSTILAAAGGNPPYRWSLSSGRLPRGLHLKSTGVISGIPRLAGTFRFTAKVVDHRAKSHPKETATRTFSITILQ